MYYKLERITEKNLDRIAKLLQFKDANDFKESLGLDCLGMFVDTKIIDKLPKDVTYKKDITAMLLVNNRVFEVKLKGYKHNQLDYAFIDEDEFEEKMS